MNSKLGADAYSNQIDLECVPSGLQRNAMLVNLVLEGLLIFAYACFRAYNVYPLVQLHSLLKQFELRRPVSYIRLDEGCFVR